MVVSGGWLVVASAHLGVDLLTHLLAYLLTCWHLGVDTVHCHDTVEQLPPRGVLKQKNMSPIVSNTSIHACQHRAKVNPGRKAIS